ASKDTSNPRRTATTASQIPVNPGSSAPVAATAASARWHSCSRSGIMAATTAPRASRSGHSNCERTSMAKEELLEFEGTVTEVLQDGNYRALLENDHQILAYMSGKMRKFRIRTGVGDKVTVEMSPYDLERGRINFRHRDERPTGSPPTRRQQTVRR